MTDDEARRLFLRKFDKDSTGCFGPTSIQKVSSEAWLIKARRTDNSLFVVELEPSTGRLSNGRVVRDIEIY